MAKAQTAALTARAAVAAAPAEVVSIDNLADYARCLLDAARDYAPSRLGKAQFRLPALDLEIRFTSKVFVDLCRRVLASSSAVTPLGKLKIFAMDADAPDWPMPQWWDEASGFLSRGFDQTLAAVGLRGFYHHRHSWQVYDPATRTGVQSLPMPLGIPAWETASPLRPFLHWAYASVGWRLTHAATLGVNGRGALIVGASGSGKSGTAIAGLMNGLESVGDDFIVVSLDPEPTAYPVFRTFKQDREGLARAGIAPGERPLNWRGKVEFDPIELARPLAERLEITALLIPRITHGTRTRILRATAHQAALALAPSGVFQLPGDSVQGFRFFAELTRRLPAFTVELSEDSREIAAAIGDFLDSGLLRAS